MVGQADAADSKFIFFCHFFKNLNFKEGEVGRDNKQKLELAKKMAEKINARKVKIEFFRIFLWVGKFKQKKSKFFLNASREKLEHKNFHLEISFLKLK